MSNSSIPIEILEHIFQDLISKCTKTVEGWDFSPRWYLLPLLRVCKLWHLVGERYLYQSISIGNPFESVPISVGLIRALEGNSRLATLIEKLQILAFTSAVYTQIVDICPNLRHVDIGSYQFNRSDSLFETLKKKPLVSFRFTAGVEPISLPIFDLMQSWPHIQTIGIFGMKLEEHPQASRALNCCPELRQISLNPAMLNKHGVASLRLMCSVVTRLVLNVDRTDPEALDAFCGCLHAWSPTLEYLYVTASLFQSSYEPLVDAISSLTSLQELVAMYIEVDFGVISNFPRLKRLELAAFYPDANVQVNRFAYLLKDPEKFPALIDVQLFIYSKTNREPRDDRMLQDACDRRNIALRMS